MKVQAGGPCGLDVARLVRDTGGVTEGALLTRLVLLDPGRVAERLEEIRASGLFDEVPNVWQITLGVVRMWHRVVLRSETIGMSRGAPVRDGWRARAMSLRVLRFPFLLRERAVAPLDFSGLLSSRARVTSHLLGAHHDGGQFSYDLEMLSLSPGALVEVESRAARVVAGHDPRAAWLRDLVVFDGYHENLLRAARRALDGDFDLTPEESADPDISFRAYLRWCARQPATPAATLAALRDGTLSFTAHGPIAPPLTRHLSE